MQREGFEGWLKWRGVTSENAINTRLHALRKIEASLAALGFDHEDLDQAFATDSFAALRQRLNDLRANAKNGGQDYRILMPESEQPLNRLQNWGSWLGQYGQFLGSDKAPGHDQAFDAGMEQIRATFLARIDDFDDMRVENGMFWDIEKSYKYAARGDIVAIVAQHEGATEECGRAIYERLCQNNRIKGLPLGWRTRAEIQKASSDQQSRFYRAIASLGDRQVPAGLLAESAAHALETLRDEGIGSLKRGEVLNIVLSVLGTLHPNDSCWFKTSLFDNASKLLGHNRLFPHDRFKLEDFEAFQAFVFQIQSRLEDWGWNPESLEDVQGFLWVGLAKQWDDDEVMIDGLTENAIERAMDEYDAIGAAGFRQKYGYGKPKEYWVRRPASDKLYPAKATVGVAYGHIEGGQPRKAGDFYGGQGEQQANGILRKLGYEIVSDTTRSNGGPEGKPDVLATNLILYGPPGTGKTWRTAYEAVALCDGHVDLAQSAEGRAALMARYKELVDEKRIAFVTFHQNYSYEDFVEGLRPAPLDEDLQGGGFRLQAEPGIFRQIVERAMTSGLRAGEEDLDLSGRSIYKMSLGEAGNAAYDYVFRDSIAEGYALFGFRDIDWSDARFADRDEIFAEVSKRFPNEDITPNKGLVRSPDIFRNQLQTGDVLIVSKGNSLYRAIGIVAGDYEFAPRPDGKYCHRRRVRWLWSDHEGRPASEIYTSGFQMSTIYRLRDSEIDRAAIAQRIIGSREGKLDGAPLPHVLIIDEINRANISKVFGELITLLEPDKRLGMPGALTLTLPYSKKRDFGVPSNLHIIGTMNTADRSIALLDTALRRRFNFREIAPQPHLLGEVDGIDLASLLATINDRVEYLIDREHRIGHAFFIDCRSRADVDAAMLDKVIPLLQEYFFEDWSRIAAVLGDGFVGHRLLSCPSGEGDDRPSWFIRWEPQEVGSVNGFPEDAYDRLIRNRSRGE